MAECKEYLKNKQLASKRHPETNPVKPNHQKYRRIYILRCFINHCCALIRPSSKLLISSGLQQAGFQWNQYWQTNFKNWGVLQHEYRQAGDSDRQSQIADTVWCLALKSCQHHNLGRVSWLFSFPVGFLFLKHWEALHHATGHPNCCFFLRILKVFFYYVNLGVWNLSKPGTHDENHPNACSLQTFPMGWWTSKLKLGIFSCGYKYCWWTSHSLFWKTWTVNLKDSKHWNSWDVGGFKQIQIAGYHKRNILKSFFRSSYCWWEKNPANQ